MNMIADSLIFKLPKYLFLSFFSDWISVVDFCKFDSAVSNSNSRLLFDAYASSGSLLISDDGDGTSLSSECFNWLIKRNYLIKTLTVPSNVLPIKEFLARKEVKAIFKRLKSISFVHNNFSNVFHKTKNKGILLAGRQEALIQNCVSLETLDISESHNTLSPKFFDSVGTHCLLLKRLIIDEGVNENCISAKILTEQKVAVISLADAVTKIIRGCKLLEEICCDDWLPDDVVVALAKHCNRLRVFRYGINHFMYHKTDIDGDRVLTAFAEHCSELREFYICGMFSDYGFEKFVCGCQYLTKLHFSYNSDGLTDVGMLAIATHCQKLTYLDLKDCDDYKGTVDSFVPLLQQCKSITHLILPPDLPVDKVCDLFLTPDTRFNLQYLKLSYHDDFKGEQHLLASLEGNIEFKDMIAEYHNTKLKIAQLRELMVPYKLDTY